VWPGGHGRQTNLSRLLRGVEVFALDESLGRQAGVLLGRAGRADVIDAAVLFSPRMVTRSSPPIQKTCATSLRPLAGTWI